MRKPGFDIITVGDCKADHFLQLPASQLRLAKTGRREFLLLPLGEKISVDKFQFFPGGNALNAAVTLSRLGLATAVAAPLGTDAESERIVACLKSERISPAFITRHAHVSTPQTVILVVNGERVIFGCGWQAKYPVPKKFDASWVYLTSLGENFLPVYRKVAQAKRRDNFRLAYNPGTRQLLSALPDVKRMVRLSDVLFANIEETQRILRSKSRDYKVLLHGLLLLGCNIAVVTDGPRGAACANLEQAFFVPAYPARRVDSTGAGDAFASGFLAGLIRDGMAEGLRWGSLNAAGEISRIGVHNGLMKKRHFFAKLNQAKLLKARRLF